MPMPQNAPASHCELLVQEDGHIGAVCETAPLHIRLV